MRRDRFGLVLVSIVLVILASAVAGGTEWGRFISVALMGTTLLLALRTTEARARVRLAAVVVVGVAIVAAGASLLVEDGAVGDWTVPIVGSLLALVAPVAIVRRLVTHHREVTFQTVLGALCLYLLAGLFFAFLYGAVGALLDGPLFVGVSRSGTVDHLYFSFTTLTTTGYGDLSPAGDVGRMLAVTEALIGQLYLVTVVALLVGNLGSRRAKSRDPES